MKKIQLKHIVYAEAYANLTKWVLEFVSIFVFGFECIKNLEYFDTHSPTCGQYPDGIFLEMIVLPLGIFLLALLSRGIQNFLHKYSIYVKKNGRR